MSRLFGFMCNDPQRVACALETAREALIAHDAPDGWGLGFFQGGEVLLQRHPKPAGTVDFYQHASQLKTDYLVGQVRDPGAVRKLENTQPYRFRSWVFAVSGAVEAFEAARPGMLEHVPDFLERNIRGQADAEHLFHVFLAFLHDANKLDDHNIRIAEAGNALRGALAMTDKIVAAAGGAPSKINIVATNGRIMLAARRGRPMWARQTNGIAECHVCQDASPNDGRSDRRRVSHEHLRAVLLVSEPEKLPAQGFEEVPDSSMVSITRDLVRSINPLKTESAENR